jgi:steroid delta-isomerase-like uncharacterized protein
MEVEENKAIALRFIQAWSVGGQRTVDELAAPDITVSYTHFAEPIQGVEGFKQLLTQTLASFPDLQVTVEALIAEGERVVVRWTYHGTHQSGELFGVAPTGTQVHVPGITVYRIRDSKVIEESGVVDNVSLMAQLGAL